MRLSKAGLVAVGVYGVLALAVVAFALASGDLKGQFVLMQLAVLPAVLLVQLVGLSGFVMANAWLNTYLASAMLSVLIVYALGYGLGWLWVRLMGKPSQP